MTEVIMPKMGDGMEEGTLLEWLKKEGDIVKSGEVIGTIQTDKATLELEAPGKGSLTGILIQPGTTVPVGVPIAAILREGESLPADWGSGKSSDAKANTPAAEEVPTSNGAEVTMEKEQPQAIAEAPAQSSGRVKASPLAKKIAADLGIDLTQVSGSGPGGRIVEEDVRNATKSTVVAPKTSAPVQASAEDTKISLNPLRKIIAERTTHSKQAVPHFYVTVEVDLSKIDQLRQSFKEEDGGKISVNDFVIRACVMALREMPIVNSVFKGDHIVQKGSINIGIAAAIDDGLLVPVIHGAENMNLRDLSSESKRLVTKARDGKLLPDEMQGSTFSISNMGMLNVENFAAIINEPNAAIVAISTARKQVVVTDDDELEVRLCMNMTGSFDHRVVDGAVGAQFMNIVRDYLQNPTRLLS
ncbi:dihydrolipoamide acetyltransferase family protein [Kamptonema cortianum]|nr:dihydrolipoamide acetyltransferase family protein [Geitlerinema splendidum]MDK3157626.1 dihydrolipoamide acetyltransferase family protein [Kamptonema cortianum]